MTDKEKQTMKVINAVLNCIKYTQIDDYYYDYQIDELLEKVFKQLKQLPDGMMEADKIFEEVKEWREENKQLY